MGMIAAGSLRTDDPQQPPAIPATPDETGAYSRKLIDFVNKKACYEHPVHLRKHALDRKADLFYQSIQWLRQSYNIDPTRTPHWSQREYDPEDNDAIPMPVYNEMQAPIQNEAARLGKPEYKPYVRPSGRNPDAHTKEACRKGTDILKADLERMGWSDEAERGYHHMPMYGGWWTKSWWDMRLSRPVRIGVEGAHRCPEEGCTFKTASKTVTGEQAGEIDAQRPDQPSRVEVEDVPGDEKVGPSKAYSVSKCLTCEDHTAVGPVMDEMGQPSMDAGGAYVMAPQKMPGPADLEPFTPVDAELREQDHFGRDLGQDIPLGEWVLKTVDPRDMFPQDLGINRTVFNLNEVTEVHVESLDWIRDHYPLKADEVKPENPSALLKWHPVAGERAIFQDTATGQNIFRNHCRVKEFHKDPYMQFDIRTQKWAMNKGRSIITAGDVVLLDGPLLVDSKTRQGATVRRVRYDYAPWEPRSGGLELDGVSMAEGMFDAQVNINKSKSQTIDTRERTASPKWLYDKRMNLEYAESGEAGAHWRYEAIPIPGLESLKPTEVGSTTIDSGVAAEMEYDLAYLDRVSGKAAVEDGSVPSGVSAAAAIQMLSEQTAERRQTRIRRIREMFKRQWRHGLELNHELVTEPREYKAKNEADEWCERSWIGTDIAGQFDVEIDPEPAHDTVLQKQERVRDMVLNLKIVDVNNPKVRMQIARELDAPDELFQDQSVQDDAAERELLDYLELGRPPVVDSDLDDNAAHYDRHGLDCHTEKWKSLERAAGWDEAWAWLWGWDEQKPVPMPPPMPGDLPMAPMTQSFFDMFEQQVVPSLAGLPPLPELHIEACWKFILERTPFMQRIGAYPERQQALQKVLRFRAHMASHRRLEAAEQAAAQAGMAVPAAPDAAATTAGTVPTPGQAVAA